MHNVKQEPTDGDNSYFDQSYDQSGYGHNMPQGSFSSPNNESLPGTSYAAQPGQMMANMSQAGTGEDRTPGSMVGGICCIFFQCVSVKLICSVEKQENVQGTILTKCIRRGAKLHRKCTFQRFESS